MAEDQLDGNNSAEKQITTIDVNKFMENQQKSLEEFFKQQNSFLQKFGISPPLKKRKADDEISLGNTDSEDLDSDDEEQNGSKKRNREPADKATEDDPLADYSKGHSQGVNDDDQEEEGSRYRDLLESTQEEMGAPIEQELADVCTKIWGQAKWTDKQKEELKKILVPSNVTVMKTPMLNAEIYARLTDQATNKDKGAQRKQRNAVKAAVPILKSIIELKKTEKVLSKAIIKKNAKKEAIGPEKTAYDMIKNISPLLHIT